MSDLTQTACEVDVERFRHVIFRGCPKPPVPLLPIVLRAPRVSHWGRGQDAAECLPEPAAGFLNAVLERGGLRPSDYRAGPLLRRLPACLRALQARTIDEARRALERRPELWVTAIDALMIGVTSFYRDSEVFDTLRHRILPDLLPVDRGLDVWSAACSDGAELLTVAALLGETGILRAGRLRGTDCRPNAIRTAQGGRYSAAALSSFPEDLRERCFREADGCFIPIGPLAEAGIEWRVADLLADGDDEPAGWDLILCRNFAIYVNDAVAQGLWRRLERCLRPGGVLVIGKAERPHGSRLQQVAPCIYRQPLPYPGEAIQG